MKRFLLGALAAALCTAHAARADTPPMLRDASAPAAPYFLARPAEAADTSSQEAERYAAREQSAAHLADFRGGADGVYIGTGALVVALVIVVLLLAL